MDHSKLPTAVAVFEDRAHADQAVHELRNAGFDNQWINVVTHNKNVMTSGNKVVETSPISLVGEGTIIGALVGTALGGLTGVGLWTGLVPMWPTMVATHPVVLLLTALLVGLVLGGLVGALVGYGQPEQEARYYGEAIEAGHPVAIVNVHGRYDEAMAILHRHGGHERADATMESFES